MARQTERSAAGAANSNEEAEAPVFSVRALPENEPIVVDNPEFGINLLNSKGISVSGDKIARECTGLSQLVIFDPKSKSQRYFCADLEAGTAVTINLHQKTNPDPNPSKGDPITFNVDGGNKKLTVEAAGNTFDAIPNENAKFKLKVTSQKPARGVHSVEFTEVGQSAVTRVLEKNGRHVIVLIPE